MKRTFIANVLSNIITEYILLKGWFFKNGSNYYLHDITGNISLINCEKYKLNDHDVISVIGKLVNENDINSIEVKEIAIINHAERKVSLQYTEEDFLRKSYQYYHDISKLVFLRKINLLKSCIHNYLQKNFFIELNNPLLWTSIQEYGKSELKVIDSSNNHIYFLPQSPNIQNLISVIGGIERNYQFNHCFRIQEETNKIDTVCEFTQLAITAAFMSSKEGMVFIESLIDKLIDELGSFEKVKFEKIEYVDSIRLYGDDKPDFRFKEFYTPIIEVHDFKGKKIECSSLLIPYELDNMFIKEIAKLLQTRMNNVDFSIYRFEDKNTIKKIEGNNSFTWIQVEILEQLHFGQGKIFILVKGKNEYEKNLLKAIARSICYKVNKKIPKYAFCWVTRYPYIDLRKKNSSNHDNIGQNIFTKIEEEFYGNENRDYYKCYTCGVDLVINGIEIASGGEKENQVDRFKENLKVLNIERYEKKYKFYLDALKEGAPPFFSIGIGWERLLYVLLEPNYFSELFMFPKNLKGECLLTSSYEVGM